MKSTARKRARNDAGFTLIDMLFVVSLVGLLATMAIPGLMRARGAAQSSSALASLRVINSGELSFAITCGLGFYSPDLPTLGMIPPGSVDAFLPQDLTSGFTVIKSGYNFSLAGIPLAGAPATCNGLGPGLASPAYAAVADPLDPGNGLARFYGVNADGTIFMHDATLSLVMPESGAPPLGAAIQ